MNENTTANASGKLEIRPATRQGVKPLITLYSESGCGKTYSALLLARGFVGPSGEIVMVDTERGRGQLYADVIPGGYGVIDFDGSFAPARFVEVIHTVEASGAKIGVLDSGSHEWDGVLEMAAENEHRSGKAGLHNWRTPKIEHAKFVQALLRSSIPWVICLRSKHKSRQVKENGKTVIIKDEFTSPLQSEEFIFESTAHGEIMPDHSFRLTKCSHPALAKCLPENKPITIRHGELLAAWCAAPGTKAAAKPPETEERALLKELWAALKTVRGADSNWLAAELWLVHKKIIKDEETVSKMTAAQLRAVLEKVQIELMDVIP